MFWYIEAFRHYLDFTGYTHRFAFWMFILVHSLITVLIVIIELATHNPGWLDDWYSLLTALPFCAIICRRLRDAGLPWWSLGVIFVPVIGILILIYFLCFPSQPSAELSRLGGSL